MSGAELVWGGASFGLFFFVLRAFGVPFSRLFALYLFLGWMRSG